jgi:hypothetical protein
MACMTTPDGSGRAERDPWMTLHETATYMRCGYRTAQRRLTKGLRHSKEPGQNGKVLVRKSWADEYLLRLASGGTAKRGRGSGIPAARRRPEVPTSVT